MPKAASPDQHAPGAGMEGDGVLTAREEGRCATGGWRQVVQVQLDRDEAMVALPAVGIAAWPHVPAVWAAMLCKADNYPENTLCRSPSCQYSVSGQPKE